VTRRLGAILLGGGSILLVGAATAWACTSLSAINLSKAAGQPGSQVTVTGSAFATDPGAQAVRFHWNAENGNVLAKAKPDAAGTVSAKVKVPADARPGYNVIIATQTIKGQGPAFGTPSRASFLVGSAAPSAEAPPSGAPSGVVADGTSTGVVALTVALGLLGIVLFGGGLSLFVRELRRRSVPAPARSE